MSCGTCSEKTTVGASAAIGAPMATGGVGNMRRCPVCGKFTSRDGICSAPECITRMPAPETSAARLAEQAMGLCDTLSSLGYAEEKKRDHMGQPVTSQHRLDRLGRLHQRAADRWRRRMGYTPITVKTPAVNTESPLSDPETFAAGVRACEAAIPDTNDYNRCLWGMAAVLRAKGQDISPGQLASLFHDPLAGYTPSHSLKEIGQALSWRLTNKTSSSLSSLLDARYRLPYAFEQSGGSEREIEARLGKMRSEIDVSERGWAGESLRLALDNARETAAALRQQAGIVAALMGDDDQGALAARQMADRLRARATEIEGLAGQRMAETQAALDNLPIKRANELNPLHTITASIKQFNGNMLEAGRFVSDGMMMLDAEALAAAQAKRVRGKVHPRVVEGRSAVAQSRAQQEVWDKALSVAQTEAVLLGHRLGTAYVVPRDGDGSVTATLDAGVLRFIEATTGFDRVLVEDKPGEKRVVFYKGDRPVACTASNGEGGVPLDIPTARRVAESFPKPEAKSSGKKQTK